jgi:hypothetical protein
MRPSVFRSQVNSIRNGSKSELRHDALFGVAQDLRTLVLALWTYSALFGEVHHLTCPEVRIWETGDDLQSDPLPKNLSERRPITA